MWDCGSVVTEKFNLIFFFASFQQPPLSQKLKTTLQCTVTLQLQDLLLLLQALN